MSADSTLHPPHPALAPSLSPASGRGVADGRVEGSGAGEGLKPRAVSGARPLRIAFVMEQVLGHVTVADNLRRAVTALSRCIPY
jgi:hypothetical protein